MKHFLSGRIGTTLTLIISYNSTPWHVLFFAYITHAVYFIVDIFCFNTQFRGIIMSVNVTT